MINNLVDTSNLLFKLLRSALWGDAPIESITAEQFLQVIALANEQTVVGLVFDVLNNVQLDGMNDKMPIYETIGRIEQIKLQNIVQNKELAWFVCKCQEAGVDYLVVKGQTLAALYIKPELRQSGDIDFVTIQTSLMKQVFPNVNIPVRLSEKEFAFNHHNITYELHCRLIDFGCRKHQQLWSDLEADELKKNFFINISGVEIRTLSPTINAAYLFLHLFFHLIREGVSLRQFCDWAVFLHTYNNQIDRQKLTSIMQHLDMLNGYKAFGSILVDELGLSEKEFPMKITEEDRTWKEVIINDLYKGGNFGKHNHKAKSVLGYKFETFRFAVKNSLKYYKLAPSEMRMMIPKMLWINLKSLKSRWWPML